MARMAGRGVAVAVVLLAACAAAALPAARANAYCCTQNCCKWGGVYTCQQESCDSLDHPFHGPTCDAGDSASGAWTACAGLPTRTTWSLRGHMPRYGCFGALFFLFKLVRVRVVWCGYCNVVGSAPDSLVCGLCVGP